MATDPQTSPSDADDRIRADLKKRNHAAIQLLDAWAQTAYKSTAESDEHEQRETLDLLKRALDANRPGQRKHFP